MTIESKPNVGINPQPSWEHPYSRQNIEMAVAIELAASSSLLPLEISQFQGKSTVGEASLSEAKS